MTNRACWVLLTIRIVSGARVITTESIVINARPVYHKGARAEQKHEKQRPNKLDIDIIQVGPLNAN